MTNRGPQGRGYKWFWSGLYASGMELRRERGLKGARPETTEVPDGCKTHPDQKCLACPEDNCLLDGRQELTRVISLRQRIRKLVKSMTPTEIARELHISNRSVYRYIQQGARSGTPQKETGSHNDPRSLF